MQLSTIDLSRIKAIGHDGKAALGTLLVLIEGNKGTLELQQIPAPRQAVEGLRQLALLAANDPVALTAIAPPTKTELLENITMISTEALACQGSSNVQAIGYESSLRVLQVDFVSGSRYRYFDVPYQNFVRFLTCESAGQYLNREIKPLYRYEKVD